MNEEIIELDQSVVTAPDDAKAMAVVYCNNLLHQVENALERAWQTGVVLGYELTQLKAKLPHGEFGKLFRKANVHHGGHLMNFNRQQGNKYMQLYAKCTKAAAERSLESKLNDLLAIRTDDVAALVDTFNTIAPNAKSMRQALFAFMGEPIDGSMSEPKHLPAPNTKGQVKKDAAVEEADKRVAANKAVESLTETVRLLTYDKTLLCADAQNVLELKGAMNTMLNKIAGINLN